MPLNQLMNSATEAEEKQGSSYQGGVEYRPSSSAQVFMPNGPPPAEYPVQVESNNAMANQPTAPRLQIDGDEIYICTSSIYNIYIYIYKCIYIYMFQFQVLPVRGYPPPMVWSHHGRQGPHTVLCWQQLHEQTVFYNPVCRTLHSHRGGR